MLILTRRIGESLIIGNDIILTILGIKGGQVRIGVNAPITVSIHREEIYQKIQNEEINSKQLINSKQAKHIDKDNYITNIKDESSTDDDSIGNV